MKFSAVRVLLVGVVLAAGCSSEEAPVLPELPGADDVEDTVVEESTTTSTTTSTTSTITSTTTTTLDPTALIVAEQFPGVTFPAASLPTEAGSINNNRAPAESETELALIAAWVEVVNAAVHVQGDPSDLALYDEIPLTAEARDRFIATAEAQVAANQVLDVSAGLTVRPYVVEQEDPGLGLIYDCSINASVMRDAETGEPAEPSTGLPQVGAPGIERGVGYLFELEDESWVLSSAFSEPGACG